MLRDLHGLAVSTSNPQALDAYERALKSMRTYRGDPTAPLDEAIALDPGFAAAYAAKALALITVFERRFATQAHAVLDAGAAALARATPRERALGEVARRLAAGDWHGGAGALDKILVANPRDILALQVGHLVDFVRGDALNLRNRVSRVLRHWSKADPAYAYVLGMHAFGLEECNQYPEAEAQGMQSLAIAGDDCWAVHAVTHVLEMQGRIEEGIRFLEGRRNDWATDDNGFAFHNWWHLALFNLDQARYHKVLALYDQRLSGALELAMSRLDATSLLWRLKLEGVDIGRRFDAVADSWEAAIEEEGGFYAFNDFHAVLSFAATGRAGAIAKARAALERSMREPGANADMARLVGVDVSEAAIAFCAGNDSQAVSRLEAVRDTASRFGGSHAQRDLLTLTLVQAATRAGDSQLAQHYIAERLVHKPASAWGRRLAERAGAGSGGRRLAQAAVR